MADRVDEVGTQLQQLDFITPEQSLALMSKRIGRALDDTEREEALKLAEAVGYHHIAVELVAARVARKIPWSELLHTLEQELTRLESLPNHHQRRSEEMRLEACFNLSLNALRDEDIEVWRNFVWLGVLPNDAIVAAPMAATFWGVEETESANRLELLWDNGLLLSSSPIQVGEYTWSTYRLHELLHDLARRLLTMNQTTGLGIPLAQAHAELLKRYQVRTQSDLWHTLADDGYIHARLSWHLEKAGWVDEIHKLLCEETSLGRNGWHEACERLGQTDIFVGDVVHAWRLAEDIFADNPSRAISLQCRYALIVATLNSLTVNLPHGLLLALLQKHIWVPKQGLAYALQSSSPKTKANLLTKIIDYLPQNLKEEALPKALATARTIKDEMYRADVLKALADKLPPELLPAALAAAKDIQHEHYRADVLKALADKLPPDLLPAALAAAMLLHGIARADVLKALADKLPPDLLPAALAAARDLRYQHSEWARVHALSALADKLPGVLPQALAAARAIEVGQFESKWWHRADALRVLADKLPELLPEALAAAKSIEDEWYRAIALWNLADKLPELLPEALATARTIEDEWYRADALRVLASKLPPELIPAALATARTIEDERYRTDALLALADKLSPELIPAALAAAKSIEDESYRTNVLKSLANKLSPELIPAALAATRAIQDNWYRADALSALANKLPEVLLEALATARAIEDECDRTDTIRVLRAIEDECDRTDALTSKLSKMQPDELFSFLQSTLHSLSCQTRWDFLHELPELAPVICALGGRAAVAEVTRAIEDVGQWWS